MTLRVWDIARGHAPPAWEPTAAPFRGGAPGPGGNNGFDALLRQLGAQGVVGKARSWRAQAQRTTLSIRQDVDVLSRRTADRFRSVCL